MLTKQEILDLIDTKPNGVYAVIKQQHFDLYNIILGVEGESFIDKLYYYLGKTEYCICGKTKKMLSIVKGYRNSCGDKECILKIRQDTMMGKYGVANANQIAEAKEKAKQTNLERYGATNPFASEKIKQKIKETNLEVYGVENVSQNKEIRQKVKDTVEERYGVTNVSQVKEVRDKVKDTMLEKYGVECNLASPDVREQIKETWKTNYGVDNPLSSEEIKQKIKETNLELYGVENPAQNEEIKQKTKDTNLDRYGCEYTLSSEEIRHKIKETNLERYGYENPLKNEDVKQKIKETNLERYGCINVNQRHITPENLEKLNSKEWMKNKRGNSISELIEELGVSYTTIYKWFSYHNIQREYSESTLEKQINEFLLSLNVESIKNTRKLIPPLEIDFHIPEYNLAIEANGTFWHSELRGRDKDYHVNKTNKCEALGINLLHIWEHDWNSKQDIVKSIISNALGKSLHKIHSSDTIVKLIDSKTCEDFLTNNHIKGIMKSQLSYGLFYDDVLVSVMCFNNTNDWEIVCHCDKIEYSITNGIDKLFSSFLNDHSPNSVLISVDRENIFNTEYEKLGFELLETTSPSYLYTLNYKIFETEEEYKKHIITNFDDSFGELNDVDIMILNGYDKIWNCGNKILLWEKQ